MLDQGVGYNFLPSGQELTVGTQVVDSAPEAHEAAAKLRWTDVTPARGSWGKVFETADGDDVSFVLPNGEGSGCIQLSHKPAH